MDSSSPRSASSPALIWVISALLFGWTAAIFVSTLPPRARPLLLLPIGLGVFLGIVGEKLRVACAGPCPGVARIVLPIIAAGALLLTNWHGYRAYLASSQPAGSDQVAQGLALQLLRSAPDADPEMVRSYEAEIAATRPSPTHYLARKYTPLGNWAKRIPWWLLACELLLAVTAAELGRRLTATTPGADPERSDGIPGKLAEASSATSEAHS